VKANKAQLEKALAEPAGVRLFLFHGPDDAGSRALQRRVADAVGPDAERVDISGAELKGDPARLADEAAAISLFGTPRHILVDPAGEESVPAVEGLLTATMAGNPVVLIAGNLRATSRLLKLVTSASEAVAFASYAPEGQDAARLAVALAAAEGLTLRSDLARRIVDAAGGNRAIVTQELRKIACFLDAAPERPRMLDEDALDAVGAGMEEGDLSRLVDAVAGGSSIRLGQELDRLSGQGLEGIPLVRAMLRRMLLLAKLRASVESGSTPGAVMAAQGKAVFWKEKNAIADQLTRWPAALIDKAILRLADAERELKAPAALGTVAVEAELTAISRQAAKLR
jgi:DNA polymerase III subunit delta